MAIIVIDEKRLNFSIRLVNMGESFTPDDEVKQLAEEFKLIRDDYVGISRRLTALMKKVKSWNEKNDKSFAANLKAVKDKRQQNQEEKSTKTPENTKEGI